MGKVLAAPQRPVARIAPAVGDSTNLAPEPGQVFVAGNGARVLRPDFSREVVIAFNRQTQKGEDWSDVVASTAKHVPNDSYALVLHSGREELAPWLQQLQQVAAAELADQTARLGCLPSTGFMVVHALWASRSNVRLDGLNLDPTLARSVDLPSRKPLPQMFHNWLGERRLCFRRWLSAMPNRWIWPLTHGAADFPRSRVDRPRVVAHGRVLSELLEARRTGCLGPLSTLAELEVEPSHDLLRDCSGAGQLEACFYLQRGKRDTENWWLFDREASAVVNRLLNQLQVAQTRTFRRLLQASTKAAERATP